MSGIEKNQVVLVSYSDEWKRKFALEKQALTAALFPITVHIEHIGSTAVPGMAAKPLIDLLVTYKENDDEALHKKLRNVGYQLEQPEAALDHLFFVRGEPPEYHLHLIPDHSDEWRRLIRFRELLRLDGVVREEYEALKRRLAAEHPEERSEYTRKKSDFIEQMLQDEMEASGN